MEIYFIEHPTVQKPALHLSPVNTSLQTEDSACVANWCECFILWCLLSETGFVNPQGRAARWGGARSQHHDLKPRSKTSVRHTHGNVCRTVGFQPIS